MRRWALGLGCALALVAFALAVGARRPGGERVAPPRVAAPQPPRVGGVGLEAPAPEAGSRGPADPIEQAARGPLPRSLEGTDVDGALAVDADGHLVLGPDVLATFDYFLAATGEEPAAVIQRRIGLHLARQLAEPALSEALELLDHYLGLREAVRELALGDEVPHDLERRLQWLREMRREHFGAEVAEALYGEQERVLVIDLERRRVAGDPDLGEAERAARLAALDEELPESVRDARRRATAPATAHADARALRDAGASDAEIHAMRSERFGAEAADRLAALDAERAEWRGRLEAYRVERDALRADAEAEGLDPAVLESELETLRARHFDEHERLRVRALE